MPKCLKCDLDDVPEDHAKRCPMRQHYPTQQYPNVTWQAPFTTCINPNAAAAAQPGLYYQYWTP